MDSAASRVTDIGLEVAVEEGDAPEAVPVSVNFTYTPVSAVEKLCEAVVPDPDAPEMTPLELYHCQVNVPVPPVTVELISMDCPESMVAEFG